ncbi:MAG: 3-dehydroquinate synthase, partial [Bacteroidia bacterium]|nr:3-dehydroquinate synthase [Bacteroidia bacterium]
ESYFLETNNPILHGEAIAAGIIAEAHISVLQGILSIEEYSEIKLFLKSKFPTLNLSKASISEIIELCRHDKKNDLAIRYIRLKAIGNAEYNIVIDENVIKESLLNYIKS